MPNDLRLDEEAHKYYLGDRHIIGVTEALSILDDRWKVDPWYLERGRLIHLATEYLDRNELDWETVDGRIVSYVNAYERFKIDTGFETSYLDSLDRDGIEFPLIHPLYKYAGRPDRFGILNQVDIVIDLKSGGKSKIDALQGTAYLELCRVNKIPAKKVFDLYLHDDGTYKLELIEKPKLLLPVFLAALTCKRWMEGI